MSAAPRPPPPRALAAAALALALPARAAFPEECAPAAPGEPLRLQVLLTAPGEPLFTRFGHAALHVSGGGLPRASVFNWGTFDSSRSNPVVDFLSGEMDYRLAIRDGGYTERKARAGGRRLVVQRLDLPPEARDRALALLREAARPENRVYRYHWARDNCATRVRDLLDAATGGALRRAPDPRARPLSLRGEVLRTLGPWPALWLGWHTMAARGVDAPLSAWDAAFLPDRLGALVAAARVRWPDGEERPLVARTCVVVEGPHGPPADAPPRRLGACLALGAALGGLLAGLGPAAARRAAARVALGALAAALGLVLGLAGLATVAAWALSATEGFGPNDNWLLAGPQALLLVPAGVALARGRRRWRTAVAIAAPGLLALPLAPLTPQRNGEVIALLLPVLLGVALGFRRAAGGPAPTRPNRRG